MSPDTSFGQGKARTVSPAAVRCRWSNPKGGGHYGGLASPTLAVWPFRANRRSPGSKLPSRHLSASEENDNGRRKLKVHGRSRWQIGPSRQYRPGQTILQSEPSWRNPGGLFLFHIHKPAISDIFQLLPRPDPGQPAAIRPVLYLQL